MLEQTALLSVQPPIARNETDFKIGMAVDESDAKAGDEGKERDCSFEQAYDKLERALNRHPLHREILYKTLKFCKERRMLTDLELEIASYPEFCQATQNQYHLIHVLEEAGGLIRYEYDTQGSVVSEEQKAQMTADEIDELIASYAFETSEVGLAIVAHYDPQTRLEDLLLRVPERRQAYIDVLSFCAEQSRTYEEIKTLLDGRSELIHPDTQQVMQATVFMDKLERCGGLVWESGWNTSKEGKELLSRL